MQATDQPRMFSIGHVAEALQVSPSIIRIWERDGLIPPPARVGRDDRRVFSESELEALRMFAAARRRQQQQRQPAQHS
jgi:DNA-binding transcriptional MerR regulator